MKYCFLLLLMSSQISCNRLRMTWKGFLENSLPAVGLSLVTPASPISLVRSPELLITDLETGSTIELYSDACNTKIADFKSVGEELSITTPILDKGKYEFHVKQITSKGSSVCSGPVSYEISGTPFVSVWETQSPGETITLPLRNGSQYNLEVDWGDGSPKTIITSHDDPDITHVFANAGSYTVTLIGTATAWYFNNQGDKNKILQVSDLGDLGWLNFSGAFYGCSNLTTVAGGNTSSVTQMHSMFRSAPLAAPDTSSWDTSNVLSMASMFNEATLANPDVSQWDVSKVTDFSTMFYNAKAAAPDTSNWNTSSVTSLFRMFHGADLANPDVSGWDTSKVTNMSGIFTSSVSANPDVSHWDTSRVSNMSNMFFGAQVANPDTTLWNTSSVTTMSQMFYLAPMANPNTSNWDTSKVTTMYRMFQQAPIANPNTTNWNTSSVTNMSSMFQGAIAANPNTSFWNTALVTDMSSMFRGATAANPEMSNWSFASVTTMTSMFTSHTLPTATYSNLLIAVSQTSMSNNITLGAGGSRYNNSTGLAARNILLGRGWVITDGGVSP